MSCWYIHFLQTKQGMTANKMWNTGCCTSLQTSTIPSRSCEARVRVCVLGLLILFYLILLYLIFFYFISFYSISSNLILFYFIFVYFISFYFILFYFLVVFLLNDSIIHLSSFFIMNCGICTNRKWNYIHMPVLPFFVVSCSLTLKR